MARRAKRFYDNTQVISRDVAKSLGMKRYFTGVQCREEHKAPRYVKSNACVICLADKALAWEKKMYRDNPEELRRRVRCRRARNPIAALITTAKGRAKRRGIEFSLTKDSLSMTENCPCCSKPMFIDTQKSKYGGRPHSPSLDRLDPTKGYVVGNVSVICWRCNSLKKDASIEELQAIVRWMQTMKETKPQLRMVA